MHSCSFRKVKTAQVDVVKAILVGDSGVGKSCLALRMTAQKPRLQHSYTIGVEFFTRTLEVGSEIVKLHMWDTAGQETFKKITSSYYRIACICFVVFDITSRESFGSIESWIKEVRKLAPTDCMFVIIGSKQDLSSYRVVSSEEGQKFATRENASYFETSALDGTGVDHCIMSVLAKRPRHEYDNKQCFSIKDRRHRLLDCCTLC